MKRPLLAFTTTLLFAFTALHFAARPNPYVLVDCIATMLSILLFAGAALQFYCLVLRAWSS